MRSVKVLFIVLMLCLAVGCTKKAIMTPEINVGTRYEGLSSQDVKTAIIEACIGRGWKIDSQTDTQIDASITVRGKHFVAVRIPIRTVGQDRIPKTAPTCAILREKRRRSIATTINWVDYLIRDIHAKLTSISTAGSASDDTGYRHSRPRSHPAPAPYRLYRQGDRYGR